MAHVRRTAGVPTGSATIPVEDGIGENLIVVVPGANGRLAPEDADVEPVRRAAVLLLQLEVPMGTVQAAARAAGGLVVLTPAPPRPLPAGLLDRVDGCPRRGWWADLRFALRRRGHRASRTDGSRRRDDRP